jgi:hypothetical protein
LRLPIRGGKRKGERGVEFDLRFSTVLLARKNQSGGGAIDCFQRKPRQSARVLIFINVFS